MVKTHTTKIEQQFNRVDDRHEWWFVCSCGKEGDKWMSPRLAEKDAEKHDGAKRELEWRP